MIHKRMRVSMAVTLAMLFVMLAFGRGRLAWFYDDVGTAAAEFAEAFRQDHLVADGGEPTPARSGGEATAATLPQEPSADRPGESPTAAEARPEPALPAEEPPALPDPQAVRDSAAAEIDALDPLHDELIEVLEAIQEAQTDYWEKRWAGNRVAEARLAKRHQIRDLRLYIAAERPDWSVRNARRSASRARARLEHEIAEARANLARMRQSP